MTWAAPLFRAGGISAQCRRGVPPRPTESPRTRVRRFSATVPHPWRFRAVFGHWNAPRRHCADNARANWAATPWGTPYDPRARARPRRGPRPCATPEKSFSGLFCAGAWPLPPDGPGLFRPPPPRRPEGARTASLDDPSRGDQARTGRTGAHTGPLVSMTEGGEGGWSCHQSCHQKRLFVSFSR